MNEFGKGFGERLKNERARLGVNQAQFAEFGGVTKLTQLKYEKGERVPSVEYLYGIHQKGGNVVYLLTGNIEGEVGEKKSGSGVFVDAKTLTRVIEFVETWQNVSGDSTTASEKADLIACLCDPLISHLFETNTETGLTKLSELFSRVRGMIENKKN